MKSPILGGAGDINKGGLTVNSKRSSRPGINNTHNPRMMSPTSSPTPQPVAYSTLESTTVRTLMEGEWKRTKEDIYSLNVNLTGSPVEFGLTTCYLTVLSVMTVVTLICTIVSVVAACYLRKQNMGLGEGKKNDENIGLEENPTYAELKSTNSEFLVSGSAVENRTYEDIGIDDSVLNVADNLYLENEMQMATPATPRGARNKSIRYSIPPTLTSDDGYMEYGAQTESPLDPNEKMKLQEKGDRTKSNSDKANVAVGQMTEGHSTTKHIKGSSLQNKQVGYEDYKPAAEQSKQVIHVQETSGKKVQGYIDVDYKADDANQKCRNNGLSNRELTNSTKPITTGVDDNKDKDISTTAYECPVYFTVGKEQLPYTDTDNKCGTFPNDLPTDETSVSAHFGCNVERANSTPELQEPMDSLNASLKSNSLRLTIPGQGSSSNINLNLLSPEFQFSHGRSLTVTAEGRPRAYSERGTVGTGNTYQQLPLSSPSEEESSLYQKLNRSFLSKTLSH